MSEHCPTCHREAKRPRVASCSAEIEVECSCGEVTWFIFEAFGELRHTCSNCGALIFLGFSHSGPFCFRARKEGDQ